MLFALLQPVALVGLLLGFLAAVAVRAATQATLTRRLLRHHVGSALPNPRRDLDPFGALAAALGGTGWGRQAPLPEAQWRSAQAGRRAAVLAGGPLAAIVLGLGVLIGYVAAYPESLLLSMSYPSDVLRGFPGPAVEQLWASAGVALVCFGVFAFIPLPPLDGWGLLLLAIRRPSDGFQKVRFWLEERNIGVLLLLVFMVLPLGLSVPLLLGVLNLVVNPLLQAVAG